MSDQPPPYAPSDEKMMGGPPAPGFQPGYPPQQPGYPQGGAGGYPQGGQQQGTVTIIQQPIVTTTVVQQYRESPVQTVCPYCQAQVVTAMSYDAGTFTWLIAGVVCLVGCWIGCCLIPFCMDGCKDVIHHCPNCQRQIARWSRL